ncbi:hypothetical protein MLD38_028009 [Melastoma candidum]|uniref:Uncharacterized protein n=1 Tax=Melastoma candidum TaxID=119954 RepID=A0ACB9N213_9MYRT|nr:hypothetical protein MLD38_028009 [Melastoma candidum]
MDEGMTDAVVSAVEKSDPKFLLAHVRRKPNGKTGGSCIRQPVVSRFMRASMGSCHDLCKHGTRLVVETGKDAESLLRKKSRVLGSYGSGNGENLGCMENGGCRRVVAETKVGKEKGSLPRIGSNLSKGHVDRFRRMASLKRAASNAGKDQLDVPDVGTSSNDTKVADGKWQNEIELHTLERNLADLHEPDSLPGPSATKKLKLTASPTERKNITRTISGESLLSFLSSSSQEGLSSRGGRSRTAVWRGLHLDDHDNPRKKPSFRRVTSLESLSDDHSPRKLRFKRTASHEIQASSSKYERRNIRTVEPHIAAEVKSRKQDRITLRHSSMEERQEGRRLFNNVIEETASKLVKVRKSKVKALVGAFETVISLQDKIVKAKAISC